MLEETLSGGIGGFGVVSAFASRRLKMLHWQCLGVAGVPILIPAPLPGEVQGAGND